MHSDTVVVDGVAAARGSFNWTGASKRENDEICAFTSEENARWLHKQFLLKWKLYMIQ